MLNLMQLRIDKKIQNKKIQFICICPVFPLPYKYDTARHLMKKHHRGINQDLMYGFPDENTQNKNERR